jgi:hypothetical protein
VKQIEFGFFKSTRGSQLFGGEYLVGRRKSKKPLSTRDPLHLVLRTDCGPVFRPQNLRLEKLIQRLARESGVRLYELAINWSHIHFVLHFKRREN